MKNAGQRALSLITALVMAAATVAFVPAAVPEEGYVHADASYTHNATLMDSGLPGVYKAEAVNGDKLESGATIGIPSVAKQTLANKPTDESPAIIMGAAVGYEKKTGPTEYQKLKERVAPYSYFRYGIINEQMKDADGNITTHKKLSGFDGSYYIVRIDLSKLLNGLNTSGTEGTAAAADTDTDTDADTVTETGTDTVTDAGTDDGTPANGTKYLHVRQEDNKALMVAVGFDGTTYSNGMGNKTGSYSLANDMAALKDTDGNYQDKPYFDVILMSSGKLTAGADAGKADQPNGDVKISFYVDETEDYHPELKALDPNKTYTWPMTVDGVEYADELAYNNALLTKYYENDKASAATTAASYTVKGSDLEIDVTVDESDGRADTAPWFWSLEKAMAYQKFDNHIIKLICEVPVLSGLSISGSSRRNVILDVNSFDIQIANNTEKGRAGLTIDSGASLTIMDGTNTSGAELAIGNNASMVVKKGGVLTIDESCTNEVEYDAGTVPAGQAPPDMAIGEITIEDGGQIINRGVINIEGAESKPKDPSQKDTAVSTNIKRADMFVNYGGVLDNYGCLSIKGDMYVLGTLNNYGSYDDTIIAHDPDKGTTAYHKGIQVTWKDVVTDPGIEPGVLNIGIDANGAIESRAVLNNRGDIVLVPGTLNLYGTFNNYGNLYMCTADEAIIPVINPNDPLEVERRVKVDPPKQSVFNCVNGIVNNYGHIGRAKVELLHNGVLGKLTPLVDRGVLAAKAITSGKKGVKVSWNRVDDADRYVVYIAKCKTNGKKHKYKCAKVVSNGNSCKINGLSKRTPYKVYVVAEVWSGGGYIKLSKSLPAHFITGNVRGGYTNPKSLKLKKKSYNLTTGKKAKIKGNVKRVKKNKKLATSHAALLRFTSSDPSVAKVSAKGRITAVRPGTAVIYVQTINGIWKTCTVHVR